jgi:SynChlorMet cassette protein ScmC
LTEHEPILRLANGAAWRLAGANASAGPVVARMSAAMQIAEQGLATQRLCVLIEGSRPRWALPAMAEDGVVVCSLSATNDRDMLAVQMQWLALVIAYHTEPAGAILLHGALAEHNGRGVILAGPGGMGKTTASRRLPPAWRSWSDDATLVVRSAQGTYWAHPWPTWSRFFFGGPGGSWDVAHALPLAGVFFLERGASDRVERLRAANAACHLSRAAEEACGPHLLELETGAARAARLRRFDFIAPLARAMPCYQLFLTLTGAFWQELEDVLA